MTAKTKHVGNIKATRIGQHWYIEFAKFDTGTKAQRFVSAWHLQKGNQYNTGVRRVQLIRLGTRALVKVGTHMKTKLEMYDMLEGLNK